MKITYTKQEAVIQFDESADLSNDLEKEQQSDLIEKFIKPSLYFNFPQITNPQIEKFKKKVLAFAIQYGLKNQKTTSIFLNFLEHTRQVATNYLINKDHFRAATFYCQCLTFIEPDDQVFMEKFITIKVDIVNKLLYCLFELQKSERLDIRQNHKFIESGYNFMQNFMVQVQDYPFYRNLVKSENCLIELNYFYSGKLYKKKHNILKAIEDYQKVLDIINQKLNNKQFSKNHQLVVFLQNLKIKADYKISKCFREVKDQQNQTLYQQIALKNAKQNNKALYLYISKKIRFYEKNKAFQSTLSKLQGKKKIQQQIIKLIQESKQNNLQSLYDVYQDQID